MYFIIGVKFYDYIFFECLFYYLDLQIIKFAPKVVSHTLPSTKINYIHILGIYKYKQTYKPQF